MSFTVDYKTLDTTDASNRFIILTTTPASATNVAVDTISGTAQALDGDFAVDGTKIKWDSPSYGLYSDMTAGDKLRIIFDSTL
jgi:hypothetical protein